MPRYTVEYNTHWACPVQVSIEAKTPQKAVEVVARRWDLDDPVQIDKPPAYRGWLRFEFNVKEETGDDDDS